MRYLKTYKLFESNLGIINQCEDILLELKDEGFKTKISSPTDWIIEIVVSKSDFWWSEVNDTLLRLKNFIESNGYVLTSKFGQCESHSIYEPVTLDIVRTKSTTLKFEKIDEVSESVEVDNLKEIVTDCFLPVSDMVNVTIKNENQIYVGSFKTMTCVDINLDNRVSGETKESELGVEYKPVIDGEFISEEISSAINHCIGEGLVIFKAEVRWKNAGEWSQMNTDKTGLGPGFLNIEFVRSGFIQKSWEMNSNIVRNGRSINWNFIKHDTSLVPDFILSRGDLLRAVKLYFM